MALFSSWFKAKQEGVGPNGSPAPEGEEGGQNLAPPTPLPSVRTVQPNQAQPVRGNEAARSPISLTSPTLSAGAGPLRATTRNLSHRAAESDLETEPPRRPTVAPEPPPGPAEPDALVRLELGDFIDRIPTNLLQAGDVDRNQSVHFLVSELYSDLTKGRATVPASVIYRKCPAIFARPVSETEDVEVQLPLHRLVEQMGSALTTRQDQTQEESVAEIETPFLQVALEDNARLPKAAGTSMGATVRAIGLPGARKPALPSIPPPTVRAEPDRNSPRRTKQISPISPIKQPVETRTVASPTAQTAGPINTSKRPPSTVRASVAGGKIRLSAPAVGGQNKSAITPAVPRPSEPGAIPKAAAPTSPRVPTVSPSHQVTKKTARIQIPPISLRPTPAGAPRPPTTPSVPPPSEAPRVPDPLTSFRPAGKGATPSAPTFRSTPPPPSYVKQPPPSFTPSRGGLPPAPSLPSAPAPEPISGLTEASNPAPAVAPAPASDQLIEMSLAGVLRGLPALALVVEPTSIPDDARISLPFSLIEPQLSNGRVTVPLAVFRSALPSAFNHVLTEDCDLTEIPIPLQEVFQNLPSNAINLRSDQVVEEARNSFPTPFSQKAEEDAKRFGGAAAAPAPAPVPRPETEPEAAAEEAPEPFADKAEVSEAVAEPAKPIPFELPKLETPERAPEPEPAPGSTETQAPEAPLPEAGDPLEAAIEAPKAEIPPAPVRPADSVLQGLFMTEDELDAKAVSRLVSQLPGVESCSVMFDDGLLLAGSLPQDGHTEGFSAMAPALFQRVLNFTTELSLGELQACTIYTERGLLSLFTHGNICLSVKHTGRGFLPGVREKLMTVTRELAGMYGPSQSESPEAAAPRD